MSWMDRLLEERLAEAAANGELVAEPLKGKPIPGIDDHRPEGWWANSFVRRERSHDRREVAEAAMKSARAGFWRAGTESELRSLVSAANADIATANINLVDEDRLGAFDAVDIVERWRRLRGA